MKLNRGKLIRLGFNMLAVVMLMGVFICNDVFGQNKPKSPIESLTDDNFKKKIAKGFVLIKFTAPYQMASLDGKLFDGVKGFEGCVIHVVDHSQVKKVAKKLRLRNYPSLALFHDGKKKEVWKADMDGVVDIKNKDIKKAISDALAGDVF
jgi:hypothetical protein